MDLFITNLDARTSKGKLQDSLVPVLAPFEIHVFDVQKAIGKTFASLVIAEPSKAQRVLIAATQNPSFFYSPSGRPASFRVSNRPIDKFRLKALNYETRNKTSLKAWQKSAADAAKLQQGNVHEKAFEIERLQCGRWEMKRGELVFQPYFQVISTGRLKKDEYSCTIILDNISGKAYELTMDHSIIQSMSTGKQRGKDILAISLMVSPKIVGERHMPGSLEALADLTIGPRRATRDRLSGLPDQHPLVAGHCLTYTVVFSEQSASRIPRLRHTTPRHIPITPVSPSTARELPLSSYSAELSGLDSLVTQLRYSFLLRYQVQALWANGILSPAEVAQLLPTMMKLRSEKGEAALLKALQRLVVHLLAADPSGATGHAGATGVKAALEQHSSFLFDDNEDTPDEAPDDASDDLLIHRVTVTPTGIYLSGPEVMASNRVLRVYRDHAQCFIRVSFSDEDWDRIQFDRNYSNEKIYHQRFLSVLQKGIEIAGQHYDFLGFSHSSLRAQTCWFMRPFVYNGSLLFARELIKQLGDFTEIRCPAKCAARIGQAFSETTSAFTIDPSIVRPVADVVAGKYVFTDGCGTMSPSTWRSLRGRSSKKNQPTSYQIRYKGAKGMLTLDSRLEGDQIRLRKSMIKFTGSPSNDLEICGTNAQPLPFKLNRQLIKIMEDLAVPKSSFHNLQEQAIKRLKISASSRTAAIDFIARHLSDSSSGLPRLLRHLQHLGVDVAEDDFLRDVLGALLQVQLREIKYRSRILVPDACTLYGISDETSTLEEGQVFATWFDAEKGRDVCLNGRVVVTRSPALHPGDVQLVDAVAPPRSSPLWELRNCVVFSQKGKRDLPSMLSGGDLDGDLYNVIFDDNLLPRKIATPAAYTPAQALDIGRPVTAEDMTAFFVDFMENDVLGRVASLHQVLADKHDEGTFSPDCLFLSELHSTAVDFSKSGIKVDVKLIPRAPNLRPDFMAPSASTKVDKGIKRTEEQGEPTTAGKYRYYESDKVLGELYRAIDEDFFFQDLEDDTSSLFSREASNIVLRDVLSWVRRHVSDDRLSQYLDTGRELREYYESNMLEIMHSYAVRRTEHLTEKEVFIGTILGRSGAGSKMQREQSDYMKARFNRDLRDIRTWMQQQVSDDDGGFDFISLAAASLYVAVAEESTIDTKLSSFGWVVAALCVPDLVREQEGSVYSV